MKLSFSTWILLTGLVALVPAAFLSWLTSLVYPPAEFSVLIFSFLVIFTRILDRLAE